MVAAIALIVVGLPALWYAMTFRSRQAERRIKELNGMVRSTNAIGLPFHGGFVNYGELDNVYLLGPQTGDDELRVLRGVPALKSLDLTNTRVTDDGLAELGRFPKLHTLCIANIDHTKQIGPSGERLRTRPLVTGRGLERLKDLPDLQDLQLIGSPTTDDDLQSLKSLKNLTRLDLKDSKVTPAGVAELKKALPKCRVTLR
jgi:internalin A